jgi:hypothetical protein
MCAILVSRDWDFLGRFRNEESTDQAAQHNVIVASIGPHWIQLLRVQAMVYFGSVTSGNFRRTYRRDRHIGCVAFHNRATLTRKLFRVGTVFDKVSGQPFGFRQGVDFGFVFPTFIADQRHKSHIGNIFTFESRTRRSDDSH